MNSDYRDIFDRDINNAFQTAAKLLVGYPKSAASMLKVAAHETKSRIVRKKWLKEDVVVPPLLIVSATDRCNLHCKECYSENACREKEMKKERIAEVLDEASSTGCSTVLLAGGEPLLSPDWIYSVAEHSELLGLVFTNGTLLDSEWCEFFASHRNMIVLFSVEGSPERTDKRRGTGVTEKIKEAMKELYKKKVPFGISVTTGSHNIAEVTSDDFVSPYIDLGCRLVIYVEYVTIKENKEFSPLSRDEKLKLSEYCAAKIPSRKAVYIVFPGNEDIYDGCLAAGRGFVHITASGSLSPCPFAPYSDSNLSETPFIEALKSPLLKALRAESNLLHEGIGGCSLRGREDWIKKIISESGKEK